MSPFVFLSHVLGSATPLYGGKEKLIFRSLKSIATGDRTNSTFLSLTSHAGTHVDFPRHVLGGGKSLNDYPPEFWIFVNPFVLFCPAGAGEEIRFEDSLDTIPPTTDFLIVKTGFQACRDDDCYWRQNPKMVLGAAGRLKKRCPGLKALGLDVISVSSLRDPELGLAVHKEYLLENDILLLEDMNLSAVKGPIIRIIGLPLLLDVADGSPVTFLAEIS
jgi:kynurenine formamidase